MFISYPLIGTWHSLEETMSVVEYSVQATTCGFIVDSLEYIPKIDILAPPSR